MVKSDSQFLNYVLFAAFWVLFALMDLLAILGALVVAMIALPMQAIRRRFSH